MDEFLSLWAGAFLRTQLVEVPLYLYAAGSLPPARRWLYAAGASAITHPVLWLCFPWDQDHYLSSLFNGEGFVVLTEALWGKCLKIPQPLRWSLIANAASFLAGLALMAIEG